MSSDLSERSAAPATGEAGSASGLENAPRFASRFDLLAAGAVQRPAQGLVLEFGVYQGESLRFLAERVGPARVYGFDSFEGLPQSWRPGFAAGAFATEPPVVPANAELVVGRFETTLPAFLARHPGPVALLHIDCDLYSSTRTVLRLLAPRLGPKAVLVFDEFHQYPGWEAHEHRAFVEFLAETRRACEPLGWVPAGEQVAFRLI